jgi:hypothetical protein
MTNRATKPTVAEGVQRLTGVNLPPAGFTAIAGALGVPAFVVGAGTANAASAARSMTDRVNVEQTWRVDWHGDWHHGGWIWG